MATYTEKLGLKLPAQTDFYNIDDFNENFRKIDGFAVLKGTTAPTTATVGIIGQFYLDTESKMLYQCVSAEGGVYEWFNITLDSSIGLSPDVATALGLTGNPQVKDALVALQSLANGKAQIIIGSYTGTGTFGASNPMNVALPFAPMLFLVSGEEYGTGSTRVSGYGAFIDFGIFFRPLKRYRASNTSSNAAFGVITWGTSSVSWSNDADAETQFNSLGRAYRWLAIG